MTRVWRDIPIWTESLGDLVVDWDFLTDGDEHVESGNAILLILMSDNVSRWIAFTNWARYCDAVCLLHASCGKPIRTHSQKNSAIDNRLSSLAHSIHGALGAKLGIEPRTQVRGSGKSANKENALDLRDNLELSSYERDNFIDDRIVALCAVFGAG